MSLRKTLLVYFTGWLILISGLHAHLNPESIRGLEELVASFHRGKTATATDKFKIGFLPVTCHLTCPVTDFINQQMTGQSTFEPVRFNSWPELKESYLAGHTPATFILAPMAIALREQGVPIKIVYLWAPDDSLSVDILAGPAPFGGHARALMKAYRRSVELIVRLMVTR